MRKRQANKIMKNYLTNKLRYPINTIDKARQKADKKYRMLEMKLLFTSLTQYISHHFHVKYDTNNKPISIDLLSAANHELAS